ncbi:MAG: hypothetical protein IKJ29_08000 [Akkermansia sp.]|nr:hypothetical protein [Akkermansia sp.]
MKGMVRMRKFMILLSVLHLAACRQVVELVDMKQMAPEVPACAALQDCWYDYLPALAPYYCLKTRCAIRYHDPEMQLGYWRVRHPSPPHRVLMEGRGDTLILHRSFVWDGMSVGRTELNELLPSLLHDALYYARQGGAPVSRREVDQVFLRACRYSGCAGCFTSYAGVRLFGGFFGVPPGGVPPLVELTTPDTPAAELEP